MDAFWDERATVLKGDCELLRRKREGRALPMQLPQSARERYLVAKKLVGGVCFEEELRRLGIEESFTDLGSKDTAAAVAIGGLGALMAFLTDKHGRVLEERLLANYDRSNPADYKAGHQHRYYFGHDILNPLQTLPQGYLYKGKDVGGRTLFDLVVAEYWKAPASPLAGKSRLLLTSSKLATFCLHQSAHYLRDLLTPQGIPLPGSSYLTSWVSNGLRVCGFSSANALMGELGREYGSINASDFVSLAVIKFLLGRYFRSSPRESEASHVLVHQVSIISYATCIGVQMALMLNAEDAAGHADGAKLNLILAVLLASHSAKLISQLNGENREVYSYYNRAISDLADGSF